MAHAQAHRSTLQYNAHAHAACETGLTLTLANQTVGVAASVMALDQHVRRPSSEDPLLEMAGRSGRECHQRDAA